MQRRQTRQIVWIIIGIVAGLLAWALLTDIRGRSFKEAFEGGSGGPESRVPKIIWSYWDNPETIPRTVKFCMESWKRHNPNYEIRMLNKESYKEYVTIPDKYLNHPNYNDIPAHFADLVRIFILEKHGGIWTDSSILMLQPLDEWLFEGAKADTEFYGFYIKRLTGTTPAIENWFFAAPPKSTFMKAWLDEYMHVADYGSIDEYVESRRKMGVKLFLQGMDNYLFMHVAAQKVLQMDGYPEAKLKLGVAEDGPFKYLEMGGWNPDVSLDKACEDPSVHKPFLKMRGNERGTFEHNYDKYSKCKWT